MREVSVGMVAAGLGPQWMREVSVDEITAGVAYRKHKQLQRGGDDAV